MTRLHDSYLTERRSPWGQVMFTRKRAPWWRRILMALMRRI